MHLVFVSVVGKAVTMGNFSPCSLFSRSNPETRTDRNVIAANHTQRGLL
jgi:hypothetical protein